MLFVFEGDRMHEHEVRNLPLGSHQLVLLVRHYRQILDLLSVHLLGV